MGASIVAMAATADVTSRWSRRLQWCQASCLLEESLAVQVAGSPYHNAL